MLKGVNKVILIGNVGQNPEARYMQNGICFVQFSVATRENWKDKTTGVSKSHTEWHKCIAYGQRAEFIRDYVVKGSKVYIDGSNKTRSFKSPKHNDELIYITEISVNEIQILNSVSSALSRDQSDLQADNMQHGASNSFDHIPF